MPVPPLAVFLFAHQDDEFGCFAAIEAARADGLRPVCLYLTDGGGGRASPQARCDESRRVLLSLGVAAEDIHFPGISERLPDGGLAGHLPAAFAAVQQCLLACQAPVARLLIHAWEGGHQDHDAAHLLGLAVAHSLDLLPRTRQFALYHGAGLRHGLFRVLAPLAANGPCDRTHLPWASRLRYLRLCCGYPSQWKSWLGLLPFVGLHMLVQGTQDLQPVSLERIQDRPHPGPLLYEERGAARWAELVAAVTPFAATHLGTAPTPAV